MGTLLGLSRAYSCAVRWNHVPKFPKSRLVRGGWGGGRARELLLASPITTKCLTPSPTSPRAIYWIHWTPQRYHDAGNESSDGTNNASHIVDNGLFDWHLDPSPTGLHESRIQPDILTDKDLSRAAKCPPLAAVPGLPYKIDEPLVQMA